MIKTIFLFFSILFVPSLIYAQLLPKYPREMNTNYAYTKFSDSFSGTLLDKSKWEVVKNYGRGKCVFVDSVGTTYSVNNGLNLSMIYHPGYCFVDGTIQCPDYISAEIHSKDPYKYGIYEGRMKFAAGKGSWPAFWFFGGSGADDPQYNTGYASEIDIAEYNWHKDPWPSSGYSVNTDHVFHWWWPESIHGTREMDIPSGIKNNSVDWNASHTFKLIYTPYDCTFYIDGTLNWRRSRYYSIVNGHPEDIFPEDIVENTQYSEWEWFPKHEGSIILSQQVSKYVYNDDISAPQTSLFEWVTYKQFFLAPEITVPSQICSTGTVTMNVDPLASNITWQVTPANLVVTSSGTGLTANITAAPSASGMGTITYTFSMPSAMPNGETFTASKNVWIGLTASFTGNITVPFEGSGTWTGSATCGASPYFYEWFLREDDGSGAEGVLVATGNPLILWSVPRSSKALVSNLGSSTPVPDQPITYTKYYLSLRASDVNGAVFITPERQVIAYGDVDLINPMARMQIEKVKTTSALQLKISPNPAINEATLEINDTSGQIMDTNTEWQVEVYDATQSLKAKVPKLKGKQYSISTSGWKDGIYFVRAKIGDEMITEKLVVKH